MQEVTFEDKILTAGGISNISYGALFWVALYALRVISVLRFRNRLLALCSLASIVTSIVAGGSSRTPQRVSASGKVLVKNE